MCPSETTDAPEQPMSSNHREFSIGQSNQGCTISAFEFAGGDRPILILAAIHGDEPKSARLANALIETLGNRKAIGQWQEAIAKRASSTIPTITVVPVVNPDGHARRRRKNANDVDLNRNFPTENWQSTPKRHRYHGGPAPASEPETQAIMALVESTRPSLIITIHSINRRRQCNNYDGPARKFAEFLAQYNSYPVKESIGYPTPGSFGTWAGRERNIPTITLELPSHASPKQCITSNLTGLLQFCST